AMAPSMAVDGGASLPMRLSCVYATRCFAPPIWGQQCPSMIRDALDQLSLREDLAQVLPSSLA
ncbi:MAG TPA: hypothetical protein VKJ47_22745, partial [Candidatus Binatia bacterium]|nr:hypothetical protein [Candidatus Binatia bacterium]